MTRRPRPRLRGPWHLLVAALIFGLGFVATAWRLEAAPDLFTDEIVYARAGIRVAGEGALVWDTGEPIHIHPPLYFLTEAAFFRVTGPAGAPLYAAGDIFALVYHARILNALLAGATTTLLYLLGRRLRGSYLGLLLAALFVLDPFGLRTNRRAMLETMAAILALAGMAIFLARTTAPRRIALAWAVVAGLLLGFAMLTKELTFTSIPALLVFVTWEARRGGVSRSTWRQQMPHLAPGLLAASVAGLTYASYPLWILGGAGWESFAQVKWLSLQRLLGLVQITGWNRPGVSLGAFLLQRLTDYGSSYALLGLGGAATAWLLWRRRHSRDSRLLVCWGLVLYPFFGFLALFGSGNDQFFYFLLHPAILLTGYAAGTVWDEVRPGRHSKAWLWAAGAFTALLLSYNTVRWWSEYGVGLDNGYYQLRASVQRQIPQADPLNATGDALKFQYFFPDRMISTAATPAEAQALGISTFVLAPKDVEARYGRITPELAEWIVAHGQLLASAEGDSYGAIYLYHVDPDAPVERVSSVPPELGSARARQRRFAPAAGGFVSALLIGLGLWSVALGALAGGFCIWHSRSPERRTEAAPEGGAGRTGRRVTRVPERIGFDARYINDRYHGIGRYAFRLLEALAALGPETASGWAGNCTWIAFRGQGVDSRFDWERLASQPNVELADGPWPLYWPQEQFLWPSRLHRNRVDLFYSPHFVAPVGTGCPVVNTVHDLIFERYPAYMPQAWSRPYYRLLMALSARRARRIVVLSQATAADLIRFYGVPPAKISVVPAAPDPGLGQPTGREEKEEVRRRLGLTRPFVLSVGVRRPHKNLERLVRAFATVTDEVSHDLVFVGPPDERFPDDTRRAAVELNLQDRVRFVGWVSEPDLRTLYALADLVAAPSLVEGFGFPALEAMACGTPVLAADASSLPEVVGDAGVLVDPYDEEALARVMVRLLQDPEWRGRLSQVGRARAAEFTWRQAAEGVVEALEEAWQ